MNTASVKNELFYKTTRSSGKGGQHVNKTSSRVELYFNVPDSPSLSEEEKNIILKKLANKISSEGLLIMSCEEERSQLANKKKVTEKFLKILEKALLKPKKRKPTKPSKAAKEKRLKAKKEHSEIKKMRKGNF
jgi:ribosome-associated protein